MQQVYERDTWDDQPMPGMPEPQETPDPGPFKAPKFQANVTHGTYVAGRDRQFKTHDSIGHARRSITMTNSRLWANGTVALSDAAIYERVVDYAGAVEWIPVETYPAGTELPWRSRSSQ